MDGTWDYHVKRNKPGSERKISYFFSYSDLKKWWNL
jgi:hypothetical protein